MPPNLPPGMAFQFYQAWLQGPHALFRLFEDSFGRQALYGPPDPDMQQRTIADLSEQIGHLQAQNERLQAEVSDLRGHNLRLQRRNAELEALVAKDLHNSSRLPSSDPPWAKRTRSLRRPSGKRPGGQVGHPGETLRLMERPNRTVEHRPRECRGCHAPLDSAAVVGHRRQQVVEVVPARLRVTEHRLAVLRCRACGKRTRGELAGSVRSGVQYGPGVKARVLYLQQYQLLPVVLQKIFWTQLVVARSIQTPQYLVWMENFRNTASAARLPRCRASAGYFLVPRSFFNCSIRASRKAFRSGASLRNLSKSACASAYFPWSRSADPRCR